MCTFVLHLIYFHSTLFWGFLILAGVVETYSPFDVTTTQAQHEYSEAVGKVHNPRCIWRILTKYKPESCLLILLFQVRCRGRRGRRKNDTSQHSWRRREDVAKPVAGLEVTESSCAPPGRHGSNAGLRIVIYRISAGLQCTAGHWHPAEF